MAKRYGVLNKILPLANRTTFVIDKGGIIRYMDQGHAAIDPGGAQYACSLLEHKKR